MTIPSLRYAVTLPSVIALLSVIPAFGLPPDGAQCAGYSYTQWSYVARSSEGLYVTLNSTIGGFNPCSFYTYVELSSPSNRTATDGFPPSEPVFNAGNESASATLPVNGECGNYTATVYWQVEDDTQLPWRYYPSSGPSASTWSTSIGAIVSSLSPSSSSRRSGVQIAISGASFGSNPSVSIDGASGISIISAADGQIQVSFDSSNMSMGTHNVTVTNQLTSQPVSFTVACIEPTGFHQTLGTQGSQGSLYFQYAWGSPTGNLLDLNRCDVGETVRINGASPMFYPPSPPWPTDAGFPNPTVIPNSLTVLGTATIGHLEDHHWLSSSMLFVQTYRVDSFVATQDYAYRCSCRADLDWVPFEGFRGIDIVRSITNESGRWQFKTEKSGVTSTYDIR